MLNPTKLRTLAAAVSFVAVTGGVAQAYVPSVADLDAAARAVGNRRAVAVHIGERLLDTEWPSEVSQISANSVGRHLVVGIRTWGVKFHRPISRADFVNEVVALVEGAFTVAPLAEEVDVWTSVPIAVRKGEIVSGDLAKPTSTTVFSVTVRRGESAAALRTRVEGASPAVYWNQGWARSAFEQRA